MMSTCLEVVWNFYSLVMGRMHIFLFVLFSCSYKNYLNGRVLVWNCFRIKKSKAHLSKNRERKDVSWREQRPSQTFIILLILPLEDGSEFRFGSYVMHTCFLWQVMHGIPPECVPCSMWLGTKTLKPLMLLKWWVKLEEYFRWDYVPSLYVKYAER